MSIAQLLEELEKLESAEVASYAEAQKKFLEIELIEEQLYELGYEFD